MMMTAMKVWIHENIDGDNNNHDGDDDHDDYYYQYYQYYYDHYYYCYIIMIVMFRDSHKRADQTVSSERIRPSQASHRLGNS